MAVTWTCVWITSDKRNTNVIERERGGGGVKGEGEGGEEGGRQAEKNREKQRPDEGGTLRTAGI